MSDPLRIALVGEGPTDGIVISAALERMLAERSFILKQLQPQESLPFGPLGTGGVGVYKWCRQAVARSGALRNDVLYHEYDILILQLDADVADEEYSNGGIEEAEEDLPCAKTCPPPAATTDSLRSVLLRWAGESVEPPRTVLCTPSKSMEAWVVVALFPNDSAVLSGIECLQKPENRLGQQPVAKRIQKRQRDYEQHAEDLKAAWPTLVEKLTEARRFKNSFSAFYQAWMLSR
jgi:hypothetical protein